MSFTKVDYKDQETIITAENMNDIQDAILTLEDGLFTVEDNRSGEIISITDASKRGFRSLNIFGKTTQDGMPTPDAPVELVSVGNSGSVGVKVCGKNILENTFTGNTINGVKFTVNADGSITANGTANASILFTINMAVHSIVPGEGYTISGCPTVNVDGICRLYFAQHNNLGAIANTNTYDIGSGATAKILPECQYLWVGFYANSGTVFSGATIYPMIRPASVTDAAYEPYKEQTLTVSTPNGLPGIPVTSGGNYTDANGQQWICDEIDLARGVYVQRVYRKKLTNVDGIKRVESAFGYRFAYATPNLVQSNTTNGSYSLCDSLPLVGYGGTFSVPNSYTVNGVEIMIALTGSETLDELADYLAEKPIEVHCVLVAPIETPLSEEELAAYASLHTYKDHTTVSNDAGAYMELEYVMDAKKYIDNLVTGSMAPATVE